ncbi:MAG: nucleotide exchange factor GrpE [Mycoplasmoidaceae bacterium]
MQRNKNNNNINNNNNNNNPKKNEVNNNDELKKENENLKKELLEKNSKINELENNIDSINSKYKNDLITKSKEAQEKINEKINEYKNKIDFEVTQIKKFAIKNNAVELINIINQFSTVVNSEIENEQVKNYVSGFKMFIGMFENLLSSMNINKLSARENDKFDENTMEAVDIYIDKNKEENTIYKVIKDGYKLHDQILIYSQVVVYKKK